MLRGNLVGIEIGIDAQLRQCRYRSVGEVDEYQPQRRCACGVGVED